MYKQYIKEDTTNINIIIEITEIVIVLFMIIF